MTACPIHGYREVAMACRHLSRPSGSRPGPRGPILRVERAARSHYWCAECAERHGLDPAAGLPPEGYAETERALVPVCAPCLDWRLLGQRIEVFARPPREQ